MFLSSHFSAFFNLSFVPFSPASSSSSFFLCYVLFWLSVLSQFFQLIVRSLSLLLPSCLFSALFNFLAVFHLCCCAPFNLSLSILPPPLVPRAPFFLVGGFQLLFVLPSLLPLFSSRPPNLLPQ